jgi:quinol monooxygenase YgiN
LLEGQDSAAPLRLRERDFRSRKAIVAVLGGIRFPKELGLETMIVEYTRYKIDSTRREAFEMAYKIAVGSLEASSHCLAYELSHCTEDRDRYILRIEWDSEEGHLKGFRSSPEFRAFFVAVQPFAKDIDEMRHYERLSASVKSMLSN